MYKFIYQLILVSSFLILFSGCEKEELDLSNARVEVVLSPEGVGDQGYNDKILHGLQAASDKYGFVLAVHIPLEKEYAGEIYEEWLISTPDDGCERSLFIFSGSEYEYLLDSISRPEDPRKDILMFETDKAIDGIYTFNIGCYAAAYLAGATSVMNSEGQEQKALVIAANPYEKNIKRAVDGYKDGYLAAGGDGCDVLYLSEEQDGGYHMQDEAYRICNKNLGNYSFYYSVAGASNKGVYRFSRENVEFVVGMDGDMSIYGYIPVSVVKHIDKAIVQVMEDLLSKRDIPYHLNFTYGSGYEEMIYAPWFSSDSFLDISDIKNNIAEIERKYEESNL